MSERERPNFLWLVLEDVSPRLGCYGDGLARTPNADRLAAEGRRYTDAYSVAGVCAPSRAAAVTGCHPTAIGAHHMRTRVQDLPGLPDSYEAVPPHYVRGFAEYLRASGYYCTLDSKTDYQFGEPFTMWDRHGAGADWRDDRREAGQPFFAMLTQRATHESGMWGPEAPAALREGRAASLDTDPDAVDVPPHLPDTPPTRRAIARQYDNLAYADAWVGDVLDRLDADGLADDTVVMLWSDHGEGLPRGKRWLYDAGINVPLVVRWPGRVAAGEVSDSLVSWVDLAPTVLSLADATVPAHLDGAPFLGSDATDRAYAFAARDRHDQSYDMVRAATDGRYKYVRNYYPERPYVEWVPYRNEHPAMRELLRLNAEDALTDAQAQWFADTRPVEELYDTRVDPHELENLAGDPAHRETLDRLRTALDEWRAETGDEGARSETETRERMWPGGDQPTTATPRVVPNAPGNRDVNPVEGRVTLSAPATVRLHCATQGASVGYATEAGEDPHWSLYGGPLSLSPGETTLRAKAVRYGYTESEERRVTLVVEGE